MNRDAVLLVLALGAVTSPGFVAGAGAEGKVESALASKTDLVFRDTPLGDVITHLKNLHNVEIRLDQKALAEAGLRANMPITMNVKGVSLRSGLRLMLRDIDLSYVVADQSILVTTPSVSARAAQSADRLRVDDAQPDAAKAANEAKIQAALQSPTKGQFQKTPLSDVIEYLKSFHRIEMHLDKKALAEVGIGPTEAISVNMRGGLRLGTELQSLLRPLKLSYLVQDEVLLITTPSRAAKADRRDEQRPAPVQVAPDAGEWRKWTARDGVHTVEARFISSDADTVRLERRDGTQVSVAKEKISEHDRACIQRLESKRN